MLIRLDGLPQEVAEGLSLGQLIADLGEDPTHLIVEINRAYVHRRDWAGRVLQDGDRVEIIQPAFGG